MSSQRHLPANLTEMQKLDITHLQQERLAGALNRFVQPDDCFLSDQDLMLAVYKRWKKDRGEYLLDVSE